jgi:hypothetical protein
MTNDLKSWAADVSFENGRIMREYIVYKLGNHLKSSGIDFASRADTVNIASDPHTLEYQLQLPIPDNWGRHELTKFAGSLTQQLRLKNNPVCSIDNGTTGVITLYANERDLVTSARLDSDFMRHLESYQGLGA